MSCLAIHRDATCLAINKNTRAACRSGINTSQLVDTCWARLSATHLVSFSPIVDHEITT
jgi:hypothetical protein